MKFVFKNSYSSSSSYSKSSISTSSWNTDILTTSSKINLEINNSITFKFHWYDLLDRSSKDLPSIYLRFTFNLPSIYIQEHHFWTFTLWMSTFILPSIYLQLTFILHWLTFNLPSHFWSKYFYIQLTFNLHSTYL